MHSIEHSWRHVVRLNFEALLCGEEVSSERLNVCLEGRRQSSSLETLFLGRYSSFLLDVLHRVFMGKINKGERPRWKKTPTECWRRYNREWLKAMWEKWSGGFLGWVQGFWKFPACHGYATGCVLWRTSERKKGCKSRQTLKRLICGQGKVLLCNKYPEFCN